MGNVFRAGADGMYLSNGGTEVFVEVLTLAVAELARRPRELRFAALPARQDQNVLGRGAVGFDLAELEWGGTAEERAAAKAFVLAVTGLASGRHRWEELGYEPPHALGCLRRFREIVEAFEPPPASRPAACSRHLPSPAVYATVRRARCPTGRAASSATGDGPPSVAGGGPA